MYIYIIIYLIHIYICVLYINKCIQVVYTVLRNYIPKISQELCPHWLSQCCSHPSQNGLKKHVQEVPGFLDAGGKTNLSGYPPIFPTNNSSKEAIDHNILIVPNYVAISIPMISLTIAIPMNLRTSMDITWYHSFCQAISHSHFLKKIHWNQPSQKNIKKAPLKENMNCVIVG